MTRTPWCRAACAALGLALASCGGEDTSAPAQPPAGGGKAADSAEVRGAPAAAKAEAETTGERLAGTARVSSEAGPGPESALSLVVGDGGRLGGELPLDGAKCAISGMVEEGVARAWIDCPATEGGKAKRGTLVGEETAGKFAGTFAASDDGAAVAVRGTWTAGK